MYTLYLNVTLKVPEGGAGKRAQWIRIFAALAEDLGLVPSTNMVTHNYLKL